MENETKEIAPVTPMSLIQSANAAGASIEQMQQLFELQLRWEANEARKAYNKAIADFKAVGVKIVKDHRVKFSTAKGTTDYKHSTLGNVIEQVTPVMSRCGLSHTWSVNQDESGIEVICKVAHILGHSETVRMKADADDSGNKNKIQQIGSTVTYLQRYTLLSALGLATYDSDDDGKGSETKVETISEEQIANIEGLLSETGADADKFCVFMKVAEIADIPAKSYATAIKALEAKRGAK